MSKYRGEEFGAYPKSSAPQELGKVRAEYLAGFSSRHSRLFISRYITVKNIKSSRCNYRARLGILLRINVVKTKIPQPSVNDYTLASTSLSYRRTSARDSFKFLLIVTGREGSQASGVSYLGLSCENFKCPGEIEKKKKTIIHYKKKMGRQRQFFKECSEVRTFVRSWDSH